MSGSSAVKNGAMSSPKLSLVKVRGLLTELNLHFAGVAVLALLNVYLLAQIFFAWHTISTNNSTALGQQTSQLRVAEVAAQPLRGLEEKVKNATEGANQFDQRRLPFAVSEVVAELGSLAKHENVRLTRTQYVYTPALAGTAHELTQVRMDVSLSGDYRPLVHVVNALERDKMFFLIESMTLTGQQSGTVNLRLRLTTYLRPPVGDEVTRKLELDRAAAAAPAAAAMPAIPQPAVPVRPMPAGVNSGQRPGQPMRPMPGRRGALVPRAGGARP